MPELVLDEQPVEQAQEQPLVNNTQEQVAPKPSSVELVLDEPRYEMNDVQKIVKNFADNSLAPHKFIMDSFKVGDEGVNTLASSVEDTKNPLVPDTSIWRYFPAYFTADLIRAYTPTQIALTYVGGKALGVAGKAIGKYVPAGLKESVGRMFVYRHGQPKAYQELAENRLLGIAKGFSKAGDIGESLSLGLNQAEQLRLGQIMRGGISTNPKLAALAEPARQMVDDLSKELIKQGVPNEKLAEVIENNLGTYLPRLYRQKEIESSLVKILGSKKPVRIDLSSLKRRKDIPIEIRKKMGEILEPAYPTAKAVAQMSQMTETSKLFNSIVANPEWVSDVAVDGFKRLPTSDALGKLSGKYVLNSIADDVDDITRIDPKWFQTYRKTLGMWKAGKTILNPATHARNMMSNTILLDMSGVSHVRQPALLTKSLIDLNTQGKFYQEAKSVNLLGNEYYASELKGLIDNFPKQSENFVDSVIQIAKGTYNKAGNIYQAEEQWFKLAKFIDSREKGLSIKEAAGEAEKWLFNYSKVTPTIKRIGQTVAPFATFTYKVMPRLAETITENPLKAYKYVALARAMEGASEKTLGLDDEKSKELKEFLPEWLKGFGKYALMLPIKDKDGRYQYLDLTYILPIGMVSNITEKGGAFGLVSNPVLSTFSELRSNINSMTGKKILEDTDTAEEKFSKYADYIYKQLMPSLAPPIPNVSKGGYSWQKLQSAIEKRQDYFGRERNIPLSLLDVMGGVKINPVDVKQQKMFRNSRIKGDIRDLRMKARSIQRNKSILPIEKKKELEKIKNKVGGLRKSI